MFPSFESLQPYRRNWLAQAELSVDGDRAGLSFFFLDRVEFEDFAATATLPPAIVDDMDALEARYDLVPRRWIKIQFERGKRAGLSRYHVLDPRNSGPITTLRQLTRRYGKGDTSLLEAGLGPALARDDTMWAAVLKHGTDTALRLSCSVPRCVLEPLLESMGTAGLVNAALAARYLAIEAEGDTVFLTFEPGRPDVLALDFEAPGPTYRKCRLTVGSEQPKWIDYRPLAASLAPEVLDALCESAIEDPREHYDRLNDLIVREVGATYQAATRIEGDTNLALARLAGIEAGMRVLDLGCGAGGPAIDICRAIADVTVHAVTISPRQAEEARRRVAEAGLAHRIAVEVTDYHTFSADGFDRVLFLESFNYARDLPRLANGVASALNPGGRVFVKDIFLREGPLAPAERLELAEFSRVWASRARTLKETQEAFHAAGLADVTSQPLDAHWDLTRFHEAMGVTPGARPTPFGRLHFRRYLQLPLAFHWISARR